MFEWFKKIFKKKEALVTWGEKKTILNLSHLKITHFWVNSNNLTETYTSQDLPNKIWLFLKGNGDYQNGSMKKKIFPGTNAMISSGSKHAVMAGGDRVEVLEIQYGQSVETKTPVAQLPASTEKTK